MKIGQNQPISTSKGAEGVCSDHSFWLEWFPEQIFFKKGKGGETTSPKIFLSKKGEKG